MKHLLLRHMYNLLVPMLMCYALKPYALRLPTCWSAVLGPTDWRLCPRVCVCLTLYCAVLYIAACVDTSRTVLWDHSERQRHSRVQNCKCSKHSTELYEGLITNTADVQACPLQQSLHNNTLQVACGGDSSESSTHLPKCVKCIGNNVSVSKFSWLKSMSQIVALTAAWHQDKVEGSLMGANTVVTVVVPLVVVLSVVGSVTSRRILETAFDNLLYELSNDLSEPLLFWLFDLVFM